MGLLQLEEFPAGQDARVVDKDVRVPDLPPDSVGRGADLVRLGKVAHEAVSRAAVTLDLLGRGFIRPLKENISIRKY